MYVCLREDRWGGWRGQGLTAVSGARGAGVISEEFLAGRRGRGTEE